MEKKAYNHKEVVVSVMGNPISPTQFMANTLPHGGVIIYEGTATMREKDLADLKEAFAKHRTYTVLTPDPFPMDFDFCPSAWEQIWGKVAKRRIPRKLKKKWKREALKPITFKGVWKRVTEQVERNTSSGSCSHSCGPGDFWEGGKCGRMGCYTK